MTERLTRVGVLAALTVLVVSTASVADALPGADGAYPLKNTTYKGKGSVASVGYTAKVTIKVGTDVTQVDKLVVKITCAEGKQKFVRKNLGIDDKGYIEWDERDGEDFFGQFTTRHKVDRVSVKGADTKPCSTYVVEMDVRD